MLAGRTAYGPGGCNAGDEQAASLYAPVMSEEVAQSGLVVLVPEAEHAVAEHRLALDANARLGVPAHVTVLFPFVPPGLIESADLERLRALFAAMEPFDYVFGRTAWFDQNVLYLAPQDPEPFRELTLRVHRTFPAYPPFEGEFEEVVPHLTVGYGMDLAHLRAAERDVVEHLPIAGRATEVVLLTQSDGARTWTRTGTFPLGAG